MAGPVPGLSPQAAPATDTYALDKLNVYMVHQDALLPLTRPKCLICREPEDNPFALPSDEEIFMLQEVERQQRTQLMESMRSLPVHMKSTFSSQIQATVVRQVGLEHPIRKVEPKKRQVLMLKS